jgi:hypothetical protein
VLADKARDQRRTWLRPKPSVAFTRSSPFGIAFEDAEQLLHVVDLAEDPARVLEVDSPSGVRLMRRVVRLTSDTPTRDSISARCLLTAGVVMPSSRAAALRLPAWPGRKEAEIDRVDAAAHAPSIVEFRLRMDSL